MFKCIYLVLALLLFLTPNQAQIIGCTDPLATNHNASANSNDGSCVYAPVSVSPIASFPLDSSIRETSGLIYLDGHLITHKEDYSLYELIKLVFFQYSKIIFLEYIVKKNNVHSHLTQIDYYNDSYLDICKQMEYYLMNE